MAEYFQQMEERDGVRWTWHTYPNKKTKHKGMVAGFFTPEMTVPLAAMITPLKKTTPDTPVVSGAPPKCKQCGGVANSYCRTDYGSSHSWTCVFCRTRNPIAGSPDQPPVEFTQGVNTVEYVLPRNPSPAPVFIFVLDVATTEDELEGEKAAVRVALERLPANSLVGLMTLGKFVTVWELGFDGAKCTVFTGAPADGTYSLDTVREYLGVKRGGRGVQEHAVAGRILLPVSEATAAVEHILEDLQPDPWPVPARMRALRSTGAALEVATAVAELLCTPGDAAQKVPYHGRILLFLSGPCARGPGKICTPDLGETLRCHPDIKEGQAPHMQKATEFGDSIAKRLRAINFCLDLFMISLDQVGLAELGEAVLYTGGYSVSSDSFHNEVFVDSLKMMFKEAAGRPGVSNMFFDVILEVQTSAETKIAGAVGPARSISKPSGCVSADVEVGESKTCAWSTSVIDETTTFAVYFDAGEEGCGGATAGGNRYYQFITSFVDSAGARRLRVTSQCQVIAQSSDAAVINETYAFDQFTAAACMCRMVSKHMEASGNNHPPALRWVDRSLIKFVKKFATYQPNDPDSLRLPPQYTLFPQFMYHLRRSEFLLVFNNSVDETVFFRTCLHRETVMQCIVMLEPKLISYEYGCADGTSVHLDSKSVTFNNILLLDGYFNVVIHHGHSVAQWRDNEYHKQPGYESFAQQLEAPRRDMDQLIASRFPVPKITICDQYGSQARYLIHKLNPSDTDIKGAGDDVQVIHTDDANLQTFMVSLKKLAVKVEK